MYPRSVSTLEYQGNIVLTLVTIEEVVEPLEETRSEFIFATEPLLSSLYLSIPGASHHSPLVDLDEVEVRIARRPTIA